MSESRRVVTSITYLIAHAVVFRHFLLANILLMRTESHTHTDTHTHTKSRKNEIKRKLIINLALILAVRVGPREKN